MEKYVDVVQDRAGNALSGASVYIYATGTATLSTIYSDNGITTKANPMTTGSDGEFSFYANAGDYDIRVVYGSSDTTRSDVTIGGNVAAELDVFTPAGTGAVETTIQAKLRESVSVKDFGAVGDGVTDDRTAIVNADTHAAGRTVFFPEGTYKVGSAYASSAGSIFYLEDGATITTNTPSGVTYEYERKRTAAVTNSKMRIDRLYEFGSYPLEDEAGIWSGDTHTFFGVSKEFGASEGYGNIAPSAAFFAFANNNNCGNDVVAILGDSVARTSDVTVFGGNLIARNVAGTTNTKFVGLEIDIEPAVGTTDANGSFGLVLNIFSISSNADACIVGGIDGTWRNGFITQRIRGAHYAVQTGDPTTADCFIDTTQGTFSSASLKLKDGAAGGINFGGGAFGTSPYIYGSSGNAVLNMGSAGFFIIQNPAGAQRFTFDQFGVLNMPNNGAIKINSTQVLAARDTGWTAMTGSTNKNTAYDTSTVTLPQLAGRVMALQAALTTHGLIGA